MLLLSFFFGVLLWTLLEYILHRYLGHVHKGKNFFKTEHLQHHGKFAYFAPAHKKLIAAIVVFCLFLGLMSLIFPVLYTFSFLLGTYSMYALYEITHFRFHSKLPVAPIFIVLRKHHFFHHFHNPKTNFGVTSRIWDRVFGTFTSVEKVRVPQKMAMTWLLDGGEINQQFSSDFYLA